MKEKAVWRPSARVSRGMRLSERRVSVRWGALKTWQGFPVPWGVRRIRSEKFPHGEGTAGSFFKNPILPLAQVEALKKRFPELPTSALGEGRAKIALAWILDHVLNLRGYARGPVRMFERQPLALVTSPRARAEDVEALAHDSAKSVRETIGIDIEREVETLRAK